MGEIRPRGGKRLVVFGGQTDFNPATLSSNNFQIERLPRSGRHWSFPEVDHAAWLDLEMRPVIHYLD